MLPETDQLTCQTTSSKVCRTFGTQAPPSLAVQMMTLLSWLQLAMVALTDPRDGAHAVSRTQSLWASSLDSSDQ